jgi:hypothetical protein
MKNIHKIILPFSLALMVMVSSCGKDDSNPVIDNTQANLGADLTVEIESTVSLDASASVGTIVSYEWTVTDPDGNAITLDGGTTATPSFVATKSGDYAVDLTVTTALSEAMASGKVAVTSPTYATADQMGRPAINTVFNFFGSAEVKNGYNKTLPFAGSSNAAAFKGIFDALQTYIFLDPTEFENILGIDNAALSGVLAVDVLGSDKASASAYGSLNGRALGDDVIDVTLLLAFADQSAAGANNPVKDGVSSDNVSANDKAFSSTFPYLATPH